MDGNQSSARQFSFSIQAIHTIRFVRNMKDEEKMALLSFKQILLKWDFSWINIKLDYTQLNFFSEKKN